MGDSNVHEPDSGSQKPEIVIRLFRQADHTIVMLFANADGFQHLRDVCEHWRRKWKECRNDVDEHEHLSWFEAPFIASLSDAVELQFRPLPTSPESLASTFGVPDSHDAHLSSPAQGDPSAIPESDLSYEEWLRYVFDHEAPEVLSFPASFWWLNDDRPKWFPGANPAHTLALLSRFFTAPFDVLHRYTFAQIDLGLRYIFLDSGSMHAICDVSVPLSQRLDCLRSLTQLYSRLFAPLYGNRLGHLEADGQWSTSCYRLWDMVPFLLSDHPDSGSIHACMLEILSAVLESPEESCVESALHGLDWWREELPEPIEPLISAVLARRSLSVALSTFAKTILSR